MGVLLIVTVAIIVTIAVVLRLSVLLGRPVSARIWRQRRTAGFGLRRRRSSARGAAAAYQAPPVESQGAPQQCRAKQADPIHPSGREPQTSERQKVSFKNQVEHASTQTADQVLNVHATELEEDGTQSERLEPVPVPALDPVRPHVPREARISSSRAWLSLADGAEVLLTPTGTTIGRSAINIVTLDDMTVSRHHATLHHDAGAWWLTPDVTRHGTFCNESLVQPADRIRVHDGDILRFGLTMSLGLRIPPAKVTFRMHSVARTTPGRRRDNQDAHIATAHVLAVADGVGGRPAGRVAAAAAIRVAATSGADVSIREIVAGAHATVLAAGAADPRKSGLAATFDVARLSNVDEVWQIEGAHVGDGHAFLQDADGIRVLTTADTVGTQMEKRDPAQALELRGAGSYDDIISALGFPAPVNPQVWREPAVAGTRVLLASDGLVNAIGYSAVIDYLQDNSLATLDSVADGLIALATDGADNATVVLATIVTESGVDLNSYPGDTSSNEDSHGSARGR